jgi:site-specific DNA-cytosine methylase
MDPLVKRVVDTGISKGVDFDKIASAMYNSGAGENQVLQAQEYYNQVKKKSPSVAGVSPSISGRTPSSSGFGPFKVKGQGDPNDPSGLYGQVEEANRRINTANRIYNVLSKQGELSPEEIESARNDYQEYRSFYPNLPIDPSEDVGLLTDNIARDRTNIKAKSQPDESNYRRFMDYVYQSHPGGENGFLATILRGTEKIAGNIVSLGGALISPVGLINDATDAFYSSVFGEETAENYKKTFKGTPLEPGAISQAGMGVAQFGKGMAEQWNENTKKIAGNWGMTEEQYEKGPGEALLEGDFSTAGKGIAIGLLHTMPELIATALLLRFKGLALAGEAITANLIRKGTPKWIAGAAGRARAMAPITLPLYTGANYAEVLDDPEFTTGEKLIYSVGSAFGSTFAESVGGFGEYFWGAAKKQAVDQVKSSIMQSIGRGIVDMFKAAGIEGGEEILDGGIQQALGIALGGKKFDANSLLDGFLIGATMGGGTNLISKSPSLIGLSSDMLTTIKITDELSKIQMALSDPSLSDVERDLLTNRARVANNEIRRAKNNAAIFFQNYTPEDLQETMTLNSEIRRQVDNMPSFKTSEAKSAAIQSVKDSVARLQQIESKYDSQKKQQVQGAVQEGAQPGGVPVEGAGTAATAPGGVLQNVGQTQEEQVAQQRTEQASAFNVRPRLKKMKVTAKNAPGAYKMMMDALSNYTDEFLQQNKTDRASVERGIKSLFDVISSLDAKGRTVEIDVMGSIDEANKLFGFEINEVDGKFKVSSKIPGANRVFDTKEGADAYTKRVLYRGVNMMSDGGDVKISVLLPAMLDNTGYHEALHSLEVFDDKSADKLVVSLMNAIKKLPVLDGRMIAFMESYRGKPESERNSEYLAELGSMISSGEISVEIRDSVIKSLTKSFLDFFKNMIGSDVDVTPTAEQLARTFNDIAEKLGRGEKQPPYRKVSGKGEESGAVDRANVRFQGFDSWKGDNKYVYGSAVQDVKTGTPIVAKGYHGTTNDFYEFDASVKGNVEGYLGRVNYFTTDYQDAAINYQSEGPDLKSRIERRADEIESILNDDYIDDNGNVDIQSVISDYNLNEDDILKLEDIFNGDLSEVKPSEISYFLSEKQLKGDEDRVLEVYIKLNNPLVLGGNPVYYNSYGSDTKEYADMYEMYAEEVADDNGVSIEEAKDEYDYEIRDRIMESPKFGNKILEAFTDALDKNGYGFMNDRYSEPLQNYLYDEEVNLNQLDRDLRSNNIFFENENGELAFSQVLSDFYKNLGFDGIILANPSNTFRGMGISPSTSHIHVFDEYANQIKLADGSNVTFGETRDIRFQRTSGDEISTDDFTALSKRLNKFFKGNVKIVDADTFEKESEKFTGEKLDLKSYDGNVYGAVLPNGVMFINGLDVNSLLHEHTHLFNQVVMKVNPKLWNSIKEAVKKTTEWSQVKRNPLYSNLKTDDEVADEVFSKIVGNAAKNGWQKYTNQSIYQNIKALAQKFYNTILDLFGVDYYKGMSASGLADLTLTELMGGVSTTPYQVDAKINELMSKLLKGTKYLDQLRFNIDPNSRKKFEKALGEKDGRALYEIFGNVQDPSKLIDFAKSKFPIKGTLSSIAKRPIKGDNGFVINNGNFGSIVVYKDYEKYLNEELKQVVDKATLDPQDLLNEVGYTLFNPRNLSDARNSFLHYYKKGHNICTLNPGSDRFSGSFVTFIVRNDADQTPSAEDLTQDNLTDEWRKYLEKKGRKNSDGTYNLNGLMPDALDPYSTSVISLQINKSNGSTKEISRYNHQIGSPDNIFSRDFDNLIEGLSDAMFKKFGVDKNTKQSTAQMPFGVIQDANGAYYNYIYETNGVYYGDGYYLENGVATLLDRGSERMVDGWVISNRGDGTATNIDRTTRGFLYGDVKKVNYIKGDEISLTTENGNFVFEVKNGAVVRLIDFPKKWRLDRLNDLYAGLQSSLEYDKNGNLTLPELYFSQSGYINMLWADDIIGFSSSVDFNFTKIQYLGNLQYIKSYANFRNSQVKSLGELKYIGDDAYFSDSQVQSLGELRYIGDFANFRDSQIQSLGELKYIKGGASFRRSQVKSLGELKYIGGGANFIDSQIQSLGELRYIGGDANFNNSQIQSLGELKYIGDTADFDGSQVQSLGSLQFIMGEADFSNSQVQSLGELKYVGSIVIYSNSPIDSKIEDIKRKSEGSTGEIILRDANDFKESIEREFEQFAKEVGEEFTESQPKFQRIATFFSGAGTLEAAMTDPTSVMAVEYTPDYIKAYNEAFNTDYKARDVLDIDPQEVIDSNPDIFHASPTCKSFSKARIGTREAKEMDIKSAESVARVIRDARPPVVTIENVPDYKGSLPYDKIISALKDSGYKYDEGIYNAADFGGIQQRRRLIIRAALNVDLPAIPDKKKPGDWFKALEPMIDSAPDSAFTGKGGDENWEVKRLLDMIKSGRLSADKPIITMGGSTDSGIASAANAGGPAPTLTSSSKQIPRIIMPDGRIKRVTPDMMRVLMGLPESYRIPDDWKTAKEVLGNGIDGNITRALIEPLSKKSEEFSKSQPKFQTPIDEAFDKSQALLDAMSKRGGIITNLVVRFADRSSSLKKKLIEANLKNARDLFVAQAGAGSRAKFFIDENFSPIYNGLNKENSEYLDKIIQLRRIIQIDEDFDSKGKPRIIHPSDKNGVPLNKERAEANLVDYESMFGSALYNDLINRSDLYFDAYKKLLSIMRDNGLITKELYDNLKSLLYQPRKFLDQFVSFEEGETTLDVKDLALNEAQIKTLQNGSDSEIMMNSRLLLAFSAKSVFSRVARNKTYTAISEAVKDPANDWISNKQLKNFKPVNYFVDGVREQFFIREDYQKQLYDSTRHLISPNVARVMRVLTGSAILKSFATQVNPLFALKNFPRDVLHVAMFTNIYGNNLYPALFRISRDAFRGMHDKMSNSKDFKEWLEYGGGMDFLSTEGFESRSVRVGAFNKIRDAMSTFGEYSEVGVRLAVYKKTKADLTDEFVKTNGRGPNKEESDTIKTQAAVASREIIDFAQGGSWAKAGENIIPYLNASIQGFRVGANYIVKNPKDFAVKFAQLSLAVGVIMFYNSMMADDDEWEKIQDGEKMRNFIIFTPFKDKDGNRYYIKIAKTQQAIAWITFAEMMSAKMLNKTLNPDDDEKIADKYKIYGDRTYDALVDGLMTFFPKNPLDLKKEITSAIPAINALAAVNNYDTFINKQVSYDYQKVPAVYEDILDPDIPYFYKALSQSIHPVMEIGPKRLGTAVEKITTGAETSVIVAGAYYLLDNVARKVANLKTDELNLGEVPKGDSELNAISSMFSPLKGVVKKVNPNLKKYQYSEDLDDIALRGASSIKTIKNASRNLGEKYYDALRGQGDLTKDEVLKEVKDYRDMLIEKGVQKSQVESFVNAFKMSAKSSPRESWDAGYYDIMYSPSSDATVEIISKLKGDNLTDAELKEYFINYKKSTGYNIKNMGEVYSLYRKSRDKK